MIHEKYYEELEKQEGLIERKNEPSDFYNGLYNRYKYPVLTREHVATTTVDKLLDYCFETPQDPGRSVLCVRQRDDLINRNLELLGSAGKK